MSVNIPLDPTNKHQINALLFPRKDDYYVENILLH